MSSDETQWRVCVREREGGGGGVVGLGHVTGDVTGSVRVDSRRDVFP